MIYASLDIETTGLDPKTDKILSVSVVIEDTSYDLPLELLPQKTWYINHDSITINPFIAGFHSKSGVLQSWSDAVKDGTAVSPSEILIKIAQFLAENVEHTVGEQMRVNLAGKNVVGFDLKFLANTHEDAEEALNTLFRQRVLDPAMDWRDIKDEKLPNLETCKERAGFENTEVAHTAIEDCYDVIRLIRAADKKRAVCEFDQRSRARK